MAFSFAVTNAAPCSGAGNYSTAALVERRAHPLQGSPSVPCHSHEDATGAVTHSVCADKPVGRTPRRADFWIGRGHLRLLVAPCFARLLAVKDATGCDRRKPACLLQPSRRRHCDAVAGGLSGHSQSAQSPMVGRRPCNHLAYAGGGKGSVWQSLRARPPIAILVRSARKCIAGSVARAMCTRRIRCCSASSLGSNSITSGAPPPRRWCKRRVVGPQ